MYGCESWTIKKAEHRTIDAFELWCWWRLLSIPWTTERSNQSILNEISPEYSLKGLMLKLKLQYFGHLMWRTDSLKETLILWKTEGRRRRGWQRMRVEWHHQLDGHEFEQALGTGDRQGSLACYSPQGPKESDMRDWIDWVNNVFFAVVMYGCESWTIKKAEHQELLLSNCDAGEDSREPHGQQGIQTNQP